MLHARFVIAFSLLSLGTVRAQHDHVHPCGQPSSRERLLQLDPRIGEEERMASTYLENYTREYAHSADRGGDLETFVIPVVFHIVHNNGPENIEDDQVLNAMEILNRDFRKLNNDISLVVDDFQSITADVGIEFRLATKDPDGDCTTGINRIVSDLTDEGTDEMKSLIYWPRNKYLNIWVCADADGNAGYSNLPPMVNMSWLASIDGVVIRADYLGSIGTSTSTRSRTLTHEVGHWLNLYHPWGGSNNPGLTANCNDDDLVDDTPRTVGWSSCSLSGASCLSPLDNVQNYMEYSYCTRMFTEGQSVRMRAAITSSVAQRNQLITYTNHLATGVENPPLCLAQFSVDRRSVCAGEQVQFTDESYHGITSWTWDFGDGTVISGSDPLQFQNPMHTYNSPGMYSVSLLIENASGELESTEQNFISVFDTADLSAPFAEGFESLWPDGKWSVQNTNEDLTWEVTPAAAYSGTKCLRLRNFNNSLIDNSDDLVSSTFDMTGMDTVYVSYKWAYANKPNETDDRLRISASGDCGQSWQLIRIRKGLTNLPTVPPSGSAFTPSSATQWNGEVLEISNEALMTDRFRIRIEFIAKGGNNVFLDDINVWAVEDQSASVTEVSDDLNIAVYPNPSEEAMMLEYALSADELARIVLTDMVGRACFSLVDDRRLSSLRRISIPAQATGVYLLSVSTPGASATRRVVFR
jgi:PKD repeat protein